MQEHKNVSKKRRKKVSCIKYASVRDTRYRSSVEKIVGFKAESEIDLCWTRFCFVICLLLVSMGNQQMGDESQGSNSRINGDFRILNKQSGF